VTASIWAEAAQGNPRFPGVAASSYRAYSGRVSQAPTTAVLRAREQLTELAHSGRDWLGFATAATEILARQIEFDASCWHAVDPGTILFTGSLNQNVACSGTWLAEHEYVIDDVNQWWLLARSGRIAGSTGIATHGDLSRSARHRSHESYGIGDELRGSFVLDGTYWGTVGLLRHERKPWFSEQDVKLLASLCTVFAEGFRRALLATPIELPAPVDDVPGVVVFGSDGAAESVSRAAEHWIDQILEHPAPPSPAECRQVQLIAARARTLADGEDPLGLAARARVRTRTGRWLLLYGTRLAGGEQGRTAVIIQPALRNEIVPIIALAYGLTARERDVSRLCIQGLPTKAMATVLGMSQYTVQDHLKAIFDKTGARSRGELVGQVFLEHYVPRWEPLGEVPSGWIGFDTRALGPDEADGQ
jgi:DNA-binding CsgD family transcriptional regulator